MQNLTMDSANASTNTCHYHTGAEALVDSTSRVKFILQILLIGLLMQSRLMASDADSPAQPSHVSVRVQNPGVLLHAYPCCT